MEGSFNFLEKLKFNWEKQRGLFVVIVIAVSVYLKFLLPILIDFEISLIISYIVLIPILSLIVFVWLISTRRINWLKTKK